MGCIYGIRNEVNLKWYIGKCGGDIDKRKQDHFTGHGSHLVKRAINKYGVENFRFHILLDGVLPEFLDMCEIEYIDKYNSIAPNGYNLRSGGEGGKPSKQSREKMIESQKRRREKEDYVPPMLGKKHSKETKLKISENIRNNPLAIQARKKGTQNAAKKNSGKKRPAEICEKMSISSRKSDYLEMHDYFFSLPADMHLSIKTRLLREQFPDVKHTTFYFRIRKWTGIKGTKQHPAYPEVYKFFIALPSSMSLPKKRYLLHKEFPDVSRKLVNRWLNKWSGTKTLIRHPDYPEVNELYFSLPVDMPLPEKRRLIREEFPNVKRDTINSWTRKWQSEIYTE